MRTTLLSLSVLAILCLNGCIKDTLVTTYTYTLATPVYRTSQEVRNSIKNQPSVAIEQPGKMYLSGNYIFLNERGKGIHIINNSNPSSPVNEAFVAIPGCEDMAVMGNILYADCYTDMMVIDISNPKSVNLKTYLPNLFPDRRWVMGYQVNDDKVIVDWIVRDTTVRVKKELNSNRWEDGVFFFNSRAEFSAMSSSSAGSKTPGGKGGSMARFAITHNHLYTVTTSQLTALSLAQPEEPVYKSTTNLGWGIETIYPFGNNLFIGASSGMHIYTLGNPAAPAQAGTFAHARVCDPVIADDKYAYVTLRSGNICQGFINQMDVVDVSNVFNPKLVKSYPLTNPHGLDKDGQWIYVCDGNDGLKVLDASNVSNVQVKQRIDIKGTYDVICWQGVAIVSAADGIYQYDITNVNNIRKLSFLGRKI